MSLPGGRRWTYPLRPKNVLDSTDEMELEPTWHMHLQQHLKVAAFGAKLTSLDHAVQ
jgi:hypothetical protein